MLDKIRKKIDNKRNSKNIFWKLLVYLKDSAWIISEFYRLKNIFFNYYFGKKTRITRNGKLKILVVTDNRSLSTSMVANLWLGNRSDASVTFEDYSRLNNKDDFEKYDLVWYSIQGLYFLKPCYLDKSVIVIHDPTAIFSDLYAWKNRGKFIPEKNLWFFIHRLLSLFIFKRARQIIVTSEEMKNLLKKYHVDASIVSTISTLPARDAKEIVTKKISLASVFIGYQRKNYELLNELKNYCSVRNIEFNIKIGGKLWPEDKYVKFLDSHEIYVCTSFMEGGPIPAMDAMNRGAIVLTTPVGQMPEIIKDGENGFICKTREDFIDKINLLAGDLNLLHKMRLNSLDSIKKIRSKEIIYRQISEVIKK